MKIIGKYIFTNLRERKLRTAVMLLSVMLSAALLFVSFSIGASYESAQRKMARGKAGSAALSVTAADGCVEEGVIPRLSSIGASAGLLEGSALYHEDGYYESVDLIGADLADLGGINPPRLVSGGEITGFDGDQVILPDRFTSKYGIERGDRIVLQIGGAPVSLEVAEIAAYDTVFLRHTRGTTALIPLTTLARLLGRPDGYSEVLVMPAEGVAVSELKGELAASLPAGAYEVSETVNEEQIRADARQKTMPFYLISFFSLTMSAFIIYSSYKVITLDRLPVIGTFRSIGATHRAVMTVLLLESAVYGVMGGLMGIPAGMAALKLILQDMGRTLSRGIEIPVVISPVGVCLSFAVAVLVSLLSAWLPVRRVSRLPVKDVVLGAPEKERVPRKMVVLWGIILLVISVLLPEAAPGGLLYLAGGISLLGLITAAIWIIPLLTDLLSMGLERVYGVVLGNEGWLAARNMRGNQCVSQNITLLFISISAVTAITLVGNFVTVYVGDVFKGAELQGFADGRMDATFIRRVGEMEGVSQVLPLHVYENQMQADGRTLTRLEATGSLERYSSMLAINYKDQEMKQRAISAFDEERAILLSEGCAERLGYEAGDTLSLSDGDAGYDYLVVGSFRSRADDVDAVISSRQAVSDFGASAYDFLAYTAADPEAVMVQIRDLFGDQPNWSRTVEEFNEEALSTVGAFLQPMHSMTGFILLLAAVGIVNHLMINDIQKRRCTAMYRAVGMSGRQHMRMTLIEGFTTGLAGAAVAVFISYMEIRTIFLVAGPKIQITPDWNISTFLAAGAAGIAITLLGCAAPVCRSRRMKLVEEIKFE